ncbi:MAG: NAD-dependent deacylase [Chloroflexi bacterium]|nr:NAD-dependent deacylase [Chloroflexota bacterium]
MAIEAESLERAIEEASRLILQSSHVVALVGAGMSVESGIPPFRGPGGLWTRIGEPSMNGYQRFLADPEGHWRDILNPDMEGPRAQFRAAIEKARPNPGHYALAELEDMGVLKYIVTQNVDGLHRDAGSQNVAEIHGNRNKVRCIECNLRWMRQDFQIRELPPRCPECGGLIKGDGVAFGEPIPKDVLATSFQEAQTCDCLVIIGTSALVYPAAGLPTEARMRGSYLIEVNTDMTPLTSMCDVVLQGPSGEILPRVVERVKALAEKPRP